eukprot:4770126-Karenia_brevis.AAC.1
MHRIWAHTCCGPAPQAGPVKFKLEYSNAWPGMGVFNLSFGPGCFSLHPSQAQSKVNGEYSCARYIAVVCEVASP